MLITFDVRENLLPTDKVNMSFDEFRNYFVDSFEIDSTRHAIFERYSLFLADFREAITPNFVQWIDGSFISNRPNPGDIDFVTLIPSAIYAQTELVIENQFRLLAARQRYGVDAYVVRDYPETHPKFWQTEYDLIYWQDWFRHTRPDRSRQRHKKGFIELTFSDQQQDGNH